MRLAPRIASKRRQDLVLRLGFDCVRYAVLVGERSTKYDEAVIDQSVHEGRGRGPVGLLLQRPGRIPLWAGAVEHDEEHRHARVLAEH